MKRLAVLVGILTALALTAQGPGGTAQTVTLPDITGTGATVCLSAPNVAARWIQFIAPSTNSAVVRVGFGAAVSQGAAVAAGGGFFWPPLVPNGGAANTNFYSTASACMYIANGDKMTITYLP